MKNLKTWEDACDSLLNEKSGYKTKSIWSEYLKTI